MDAVNPIAKRWIEDGKRDPDAFWEKAADEIQWFRKWDDVFEWDFPQFKWLSLIHI